VSRRPDAGGPIGLPGLEAVERQLDDVIAVLEAERRRMGSSVVKRPAWKNLVFAGAAGTGKSRTAAAVGHIYKELGLLSSGHLDEVPAAELVGATRTETSTLVAGAARHSTGGVLMINDAHAWDVLPDHGQHVLWELYKALTEYRNEMRDQLTVILAGQAEPLRELLHGSPPLAARFSAVIDFPGYTPVQLTAIFGTLAGETGLALTREAENKAAALLGQAEADNPSRNARLAVRLLNQAIAAQARRLAASPGTIDPAVQSTVIDADIPEHLDHNEQLSQEVWSGQYL
jgi:DNA-binding transcriptional regulator YdaS (Cro superfamily)